MRRTGMVVGLVAVLLISLSPITTGAADELTPQLLEYIEAAEGPMDARRFTAARDWGRMAVQCLVVDRLWW